MSVSLPVVVLRKYNNLSPSELNEIAVRVENILAEWKMTMAKPQDVSDEEIKRKLYKYLEPLTCYVEKHLCNLDKFCNSEYILDLDESFGDVLTGFVELISAFKGKIKKVESEGLIKCSSVNELREE